MAGDIKIVRPDEIPWEKTYPIVAATLAAWDVGLSRAQIDSIRGMMPYYLSKPSWELKEAIARWEAEHVGQS